jgi:hypothetical protein
MFERIVIIVWSDGIACSSLAKSRVSEWEDGTLALQQSGHGVQPAMLPRPAVVPLWQRE